MIPYYYSTMTSLRRRYDGTTPQEGTLRRVSSWAENKTRRISHLCGTVMVMMVMVMVMVMVMMVLVLVMVMMVMMVMMVG